MEQNSSPRTQRVHLTQTTTEGIKPPATLPTREHCAVAPEWLFSLFMKSSTARAPIVPSLPRLDSRAAFAHCCNSFSTLVNSSVNCPPTPPALQHLQIKTVERTSPYDYRDGPSSHVHKNLTIYSKFANGCRLGDFNRI